MKRSASASNSGGFLREENQENIQQQSLVPPNAPNEGFFEMTSSTQSTLDSNEEFEVFEISEQLDDPAAEFNMVDYDFDESKPPSPKKTRNWFAESNGVGPSTSWRSSTPVWTQAAGPSTSWQSSTPVWTQAAGPSILWQAPTPTSTQAACPSTSWQAPTQAAGPSTSWQVKAPVSIQAVEHETKANPTAHSSAGLAEMEISGTSSDDENPRGDREKRELELIEACCREINKDYFKGLDESDRHKPNMITPYKWKEFRELVEQSRELRNHGDGEKLLMTINGLLYKMSTMKPICSLPSCFSTDGTTPNKNTRCSQHHGNRTSYAVLELVFNERVLDVDISVGVEHVIIMFSHYQGDSPAEIKARYLDEYERSGLMRQTMRHLKRKNLKQSAKQLKRTKTITIRRKWIITNALLASRRFYVIVMAAYQAYTCLRKDNEYKVVPHGEFKGKHLEFLTGHVALDGEEEYRVRALEELMEDVDEEELQTYGTHNPIPMTTTRRYY